MFGRRALLLGGAAIAAAAVVPAMARGPCRSHIVAGPAAPIDILFDRWGVGHVRAHSIADAFFADGYLAAQDRLWDLDLGHRGSLGRLAEVFGADFVERDTANRLVLFRGDIDAELAALPQVVQDAARAYVAGVNARIGETRANPALLPPEFTLLGYAPIDWAVGDLIRIRAEPVGNTGGEIRRARLLARDALAADALLTPLDPPHTPLIPDGLDLAAIGPADLGLFAVLQAPLPFAAMQPAGDDAAHSKRNAGSNSWVVAGERSATGRPILANDPHLGFSVPGPRQVIHLSAPGLDVIGAGAPGMPGVMQGHNDAIAFGRTNFHIDQEDLFVLATDPDDPDRYRHAGGWKRLERVETRIAVRGEPARTVTLRYAVQGPVVSADPARNRAVAVAATWLAPGANGLLANIGIDLARDWTEFRAALRLHTSPTNFTYADTAGHIGWHAAGGLPARADGHDGLLPAPGDGRYDWRGLQTLDDLPSVFDPPRGWFASSNEMNLPPDYPAEQRRVSFEWRDRFRYERVAQVLEGSPRLSLAACVALQHDSFSALALAVVALLPQAVPAGLAAEAALLRGWDGHVEAGSPAAALYEVWWTHLGAAWLGLIVPPHLRDLLDGPVNATRLLADLRSPGPAFGPEPAARRDALLLDALGAARDELRRRLGPMIAGWSWGALHRIEIRHPLDALACCGGHFPAVGHRMPSGGDAYTVMARWYNGRSHRPDPYAVTGGASFLMVCDVGAWDRSLYLNFPGQSGDPRSPHYDDAVASWQRGEMQPLPFSRAAVDRASVATLRLLPAA